MAASSTSVQQARQSREHKKRRRVSVFIVESQAFARPCEYTLFTFSTLSIQMHTTSLTCRDPAQARATEYQIPLGKMLKQRSGQHLSCSFLRPFCTFLRLKNHSPLLCDPWRPLRHGGSILLNPHPAKPTEVGAPSALSSSRSTRAAS
jgi:hypothetical protein